jgi:hypothetical protein
MLLVPPVVPATAQDCREIDDDTRRLVCYDQQRPGTAARKPQASEHPQVKLRVFSREAINCGRSFDSRIIMTMGCKKNATTLSFGTLCNASSTGGPYRNVTISLDGGRESVVSGRSVNSRRNSVWASSDAKGMISRMLGKSKMVLRMTTSSADAFTGTFNIARLAETIRPLREACGW